MKRILKFSGISCFSRWVYLPLHAEDPRVLNINYQKQYIMKRFKVALTKADNVVIRVLVCVIVFSVAVALLTACTSEEPETNVSVCIEADTTQLEPVTISFDFPEVSITPMTRAAIADAASRLDVWIYESDTELTAVHQSSSSVEFGSVSLSLNKTKTYTLYALAHKATAACTLADGIISFPDDKPKESFFYTTTFSPATTNSINAQMSRITGKFTLQTTDAVPDDVDHMRFIIKDTGTRFDVSGSPANITDRTVDFPNITRKADGTCSFSFYILSTADAPTNFDIVVTAYASDNSIIETKTFDAVPIRNSYRTTYTGAFFITSAFSMTFTCADWQDYDTINF